MADPPLPTPRILFRDNSNSNNDLPITLPDNNTHGCSPASIVNKPFSVVIIYHDVESKLHITFTTILQPIHPYVHRSHAFNHASMVWAFEPSNSSFASPQCLDRESNSGLQLLQHHQGLHHSLHHGLHHRHRHRHRHR